MRITYCPDTWDAYGQEEIEAVIESLNSGWLAPGERVKQFESEIAELFGKKYGVMVNSGSSANLLAAEEVGDKPAQTPALTFTTTLSYLKDPWLSDVEEGTYQIDWRSKPAGMVVFVPNLLGNVPDWSKTESSYFVVEDSCDTITDVGKDYSRITTTSFYASHIVTCAGGGGMIMCNDEEIYQRLLSKRAWGRPVIQENDLDKRFTEIEPGLVYDAKFRFERIGHNLQPIELQAAFGLAQLKKLDQVKSRRKAVFHALMDFFHVYEDRFFLPITRPGASWMNFPLTIKDGLDRNDLCRYLEENNIQTRPIFSGNVTKQPAFKHLSGSFPVASKVMRDGFLLGAHQGMTPAHLDYLFGKLEAYIG